MEKLGFDCELADNGLKGLDLLKEDKNRADLVLMDLRWDMHNFFNVMTTRPTPNPTPNPFHIPTPTPQNARHGRDGVHQEDQRRAGAQGAADRRYDRRGVLCVVCCVLCVGCGERSTVPALVRAWFRYLLPVHYPVPHP
jgi:hypothetical protein